MEENRWAPLGAAHTRHHLESRRSKKLCWDQGAGVQLRSCVAVQGENPGEGAAAMRWTSCCSSTLIKSPGMGTHRGSVRFLQVRRQSSSKL